MSCSLNDHLLIEDDVESPSVEGEHWLTRRHFVQSAGVLTAAVAAGVPHTAEAAAAHTVAPQTSMMKLKVNGEEKSVSLDTRTSLLDALREHMD